MSSVGRVNVKRERGGGLLLKNRSNEFECGKKKVDLILDTCVGSLGYGQCDQMVKLLCNVWSFAAIKMYPIAYEVCQNRFKLSQNTK